MVSRVCSPLKLRSHQIIRIKKIQLSIRILAKSVGSTTDSTEDFCSHGRPPNSIQIRSEIRAMCAMWARSGVARVCRSSVSSSKSKIQTSKERSAPFFVLSRNFTIMVVVSICLKLSTFGDILGRQYPYFSARLCTAIYGGLFPNKICMTWTCFSL